MTSLSLVYANTPKAHFIADHLIKRYKFCDIESANTLVVIGGDGFMLDTLRTYYGTSHNFYGINSGTVGFLMNLWEESADLLTLIHESKSSILNPLKVEAIDLMGSIHTNYAINEIVLFRHTPKTIHLTISVNDIVRCQNLVGDGVLVSTPAGSTAYNRSVGGAIIPLGTPLITLTPINPYTLKWKGALLPQDVIIQCEVIDPTHRITLLTADNLEITQIESAKITLDSFQYPILFDCTHHLEERILRQQFF